MACGYAQWQMRVCCSLAYRMERNHDCIESGEDLMEESNEKNVSIEKTVKSGITFGSALAMVISYTNWHSVGWAVIHGLMSWVYVVYYVLKY